MVDIKPGRFAEASAPTPAINAMIIARKKNVERFGEIRCIRPWPDRGDRRDCDETSRYGGAVDARP
jgi:hypothetical protein